jgi:hypothetical protein
MACFTMRRLDWIVASVFLVLGLSSDSLIGHRTANVESLPNWGKRSYQLFEDPMAERLDRSDFQSGWAELTDLVRKARNGAAGTEVQSIWTSPDWIEPIGAKRYSAISNDGDLGSLGTGGGIGGLGGGVSSNPRMGGHDYFAGSPIYPLLGPGGGSGGSPSGYPVSELTGGGGSGGGGFGSRGTQNDRSTSAASYNDDLTKELTDQLNRDATRTPESGLSIAFVAGVFGALVSLTRRFR